MTHEKILAAQKAADRFMKCAYEVLRSEDALVLGCPIGPSKRTGALRRASMDLTRALSEMRKPE